MGDLTNQIPQHLKASLEAIENGNTFLHFAWIGQRWVYNTDLPTDASCKLNLPLSLSRHSGAAVLKQATSRPLPSPLQAGDAVVACAGKYIAGTHGENSLSLVKSVAKPNSVLNVCFASHTQMGAPLKVAAVATEGLRASLTGHSVQCMGLTLTQVQMVQTPNGDDLSASLVSHSRGNGPRLVSALLVTAVQAPALFLGDAPSPGDILAMVNGVSLLQIHDDSAEGQPWQTLDAELQGGGGTSSIVLYKAPLHGPHSTSTPYAVLARQTGLLMYLTRLTQEFMGRFPDLQRAHQMSRTAASTPPLPPPPPQSPVFVAPISGPAQGTTLLDEVVFGAAISRSRFLRRMQELVLQVPAADLPELLLPAAGMTPSPDFGKSRGVMGVIVAQATGPGAFGAPLARDHSRSLRYSVGLPAPPLSSSLRRGPPSTEFTLPMALSLLDRVSSAVGVAQLRPGSADTYARAAAATARLLPARGSLLNRTDPASMERGHMVWSAQWQGRREAHSALLLRMLYARQFLKGTRAMERSRQLLQTAMQQQGSAPGAIEAIRSQLDQQQRYVQRAYGTAPYVGDLDTASACLGLPSNTADMLASACESTRVPPAVGLPALLEGARQALGATQAYAADAAVAGGSSGSSPTHRALELTRRVMAGIGIRSNMREFFAQKLASQRSQALSSAGALPPGYSAVTNMASGPRVPLVRSGSSNNMDKGAFVAVHVDALEVRCLVDPASPPPAMQEVANAVLQPQSDTVHPMLPGVWRARNTPFPSAQGLGVVGHNLISDAVMGLPSLAPAGAFPELQPETQLPATFGRAGSSACPAPRKQFKSKRGSKQMPPPLGEHSTPAAQAARMLLGAQGKPAAGRWVAEPGGVLQKLRSTTRSDGLQANLVAPSDFGMRPLQRRLLRAVWGRNAALDGYDSEEEAAVPLPAPPTKRKKDQDGTPRAAGVRKDILWGPWRGVPEAHARRRAAARGAQGDAEKLVALHQWGHMSAMMDPLHPSSLSVLVASRSTGDSPSAAVPCWLEGAPELIGSAVHLQLAPGQDGSLLAHVAPQLADARVAGKLDASGASLAVSVAVAEQSSTPPNLAQLLSGVKGASVLVDFPPMSWAAVDSLHVSRLGIQLPATNVPASVLGRRQWSAPTVAAMLQGLKVDGDYGLVVPGTWAAHATRDGAADDSLLRALYAVDAEGGDKSRPLLSAEALDAQRALLLASAADTPVLATAYTGAQWWDRAKAAWVPKVPGAPPAAITKHSLLQHLTAQAGASGAVARAGIRELKKAVGGVGTQGFEAALLETKPTTAFGATDCQSAPSPTKRAATGVPQANAEVQPVDVIGGDSNGAWQMPYVPPPGWWDDSRRAAVAQLASSAPAGAAAPVQQPPQAAAPAGSTSTPPASRGRKRGRSARRSEGGGGSSPAPLPLCARVGCSEHMSAVSKYCSTACGIAAAELRLQAALQFCTDVLHATEGAATEGAGTTAAERRAPSDTVDTADTFMPETPNAANDPFQQGALHNTAASAPSPGAQPITRLLGMVVSALSRCALSSAIAENSEQEYTRVVELFLLSRSKEHSLPVGSDGFPLLPPVAFAGVQDCGSDQMSDAHRQAMQDCTLATWFPVGETGGHALDACSGSSQKRRHPAASISSPWEQLQKQMLGLLSQPASDFTTHGVIAARPSRRRRTKQRTPSGDDPEEDTAAAEPQPAVAASTQGTLETGLASSSSAAADSAPSGAAGAEAGTWKQLGQKLLPQGLQPSVDHASLQMALAHAVASVAHLKPGEVGSLTAQAVLALPRDPGATSVKAVSRIRQLASGDPVSMSRACLYPQSLMKEPPSVGVLAAACVSPRPASPAAPTPTPTSTGGTQRGMVQLAQASISVRIDSCWGASQTSWCAGDVSLPTQVPSHGVPQAMSQLLPATGAPPPSISGDSELSLYVQQMWDARHGTLAPWLRVISGLLANELSRLPLSAQLRWVEAACAAMRSMLVDCVVTLQPLRGFTGALSITGLIDALRSELQKDPCTCRAVDCCMHSCWEQAVDSQLSAGAVFDLAQACGVIIGGGCSAAETSSEGGAK